MESSSRHSSQTVHSHLINLIGLTRQTVQPCLPEGEGSTKVGEMVKDDTKGNDRLRPAHFKYSQSIDRHKTKRAVSRELTNLISTG
jgi:hypothetical protein